MSAWLVGVLANGLIAVAFVVIAALIAQGLVRTRQRRSNPLATVRDDVERARAAELAEVLDLLPEAVLVLGEEGAVEHANPAAQALGPLPELRSGALAAALEATRTTREPRDGLEVDVRDGAGRARRLRGSVRAHGELLVLSLTDVTERDAAERALAASEQQLRTTLEGMAEGVVVLDADGRVRALNPAAQAMGAPAAGGDLSRASLVADVELHDAHGAPLAPDASPAGVAARTGQPVRGVRVEVRRVGAPSLWLDVNAVPLPAEGGPRHPVVVSFTDVTERVVRERALAEAQERTRATFHAAPIGMSISGLDGRLVEVNQAMADLLRTTPEDLLGRRARDLFHPDDHAISRRGRDLLLSGAQESTRIEARLLREDGTTVWAQLDRTALRDADGVPTGVVGQIQDISERRDHEAQLRHLADHDALTGLLNRRGFARVLGDQVARASRYGDQGALLVVDLDGFKRVNDHFGHATGDALISAVARLLRASLRRSDHLARLGGDEFAVLLPQGGEEEAGQVARKLVDALRASREALPGAEVAPVRASIGVVAVRAGEDQDELLVQADLAMYAAKDAGGDRHALATPCEPGHVRPLGGPRPV